MNLRTYFGFCFISSIIIYPRDVVIKFQNGKIRGIVTTSSRGREYYSFRGIFYAKSPEGPRRFKPPTPTRQLSEDEELDATIDGPICWQRDFTTKTIQGQEDCLVLNVYTPGNANSNAKKKFAVLVWIHGGGWQHGHGSSWFYGPGKFMDKEIVFVSINYRLGPLGFFSTNDSAAVGNYGMLDQVEALKWIRDNIEDFGGDPGQVTLFGQSAGAVSALYHMFSPLSKDLFHRCIAMSGNPLCPWATANDPVYWARKLGASLNCPVNSTSELVGCLRNVSPYDINEAVIRLSAFDPMRFFPTIDGKFLESCPRDLMAQGRIYNKVPVITGITKHEGAGLYAITFSKLMEYSPIFLEEVIKSLFSFPGNTTHVENIISKKYFNCNVDVTDKFQVAKITSKLITDSMEIAHINTIDYLTEAGVKTYAYSFDFEGFLSITQIKGIYQRFGVGHCDDLFQMFNVIGLSLSDYEVSDGIISMWTNFATTGDPNGNLDVNWLPATEQELPVLHIDKPTSTDFINRTEDWRFNFWLKEVPEVNMRHHNL